MGQVNATTITSGTIVNTDIAAGAGLSASKLQHQHVLMADWGYADTDGTVATEDHTVFIASSAGEIREVKVWLVDSGTNTDIDFDLEVNGSSILTGDINVVNGTGDQVAVSGTISSGTLAAGDYVTAVIKTVTQNTGATGPRMQITLDSTYV
jgi:hypothetical protein